MKTLSFFFLLISYPGLVFSDMVLGVHPYLDSATVIQRFQPLANYLSLKLDTDISVRVGKDYDSHIQEIGRDNLDIAFLGPAAYINMVKRYNFKPLLVRLEADNSPMFRGHIIVRSDSKITNINQLKHHYFAFGDSNSTMSTLVPQAMLLQNGISLDSLSGYRFYKGHKNVAFAVLAGDADAGAVKDEVYEQYKSKSIRSIIQTPPISEHVFVTRANMDPKLIQRIQTLLLDIRTDELVKQTLKPIKKNLTALVPVKDEDYDSLRQLMQLLDKRTSQ